LRSKLTIDRESDRESGDIEQTQSVVPDVGEAFPVEKMGVLRDMGSGHKQVS